MKNCYIFIIIYNTSIITIRAAYFKLVLYAVAVWWKVMVDIIKVDNCESVRLLKVLAHTYHCINSLIYMFHRDKLQIKFKI